MRQLASLAWKEWREVRAFLWIALFVFVVLPVIGGIEAIAQKYAYQFRVEADWWVYSLGGVLAIFVAAGSTCRDFQGRLEDFWRSRPVGVGRWLSVKYVVGLSVVFIACVIPLEVQNLFPGKADAHISLRSLFPLMLFWSVLFSMAFLAGCLVRRTAHAAMLGLAGLLLLYTLPMVIPPLSWMSVTIAMSSSADHMSGFSSDVFSVFGATYVKGMLIIGATTTLLAVIVVRREWRIESGRKMMYGALMTVILILLISADYQLGSNLPVLQEFDLPKEEKPFLLQMNDNHGYLITSILKKAENGINGSPDLKYRQIQIASNGITLGERQDLPLDAQPIFYSDTSLDRPYRVEEGYDGQVTWSSILYVRDAKKFNGDVFLKQQVLWTDHVPKSGPSNWAPATVVQWQGRLYIIGRRLVILDASEPTSPRIISVKNPYYIKRWYYADHLVDWREKFYPNLSYLTLELPPIPELPMQKRIEAAVDLFGNGTLIGTGNVLCVPQGVDVSFYAVEKSDDKSVTFKRFGFYEMGQFSGEEWITASVPYIPGVSDEETLSILFGPRNRFWRPGVAVDGDELVSDWQNRIYHYRLNTQAKVEAFERVGDYEPAPLEQIFGLLRYPDDLQFRDGIVYACGRGNPMTSNFNGRLDVFDLRGKEGIKSAGHFGAPRLGPWHTLPGRRALMTTEDKVYVIGLQTTAAN